MLNQQNTPIVSDVEAVLQPYLAAGEELIWAGQPVPTAYAERHSRALYGCLQLLLFSCGVSIVLILFMGIAANVRGGDALLVTAVYFLTPAAIVWLICQWYQSRKQRAAAAIVYAITNQRLLTVCTRPPTSVHSYYLSAVREIKVESERKGVGNVFFDEWITYDEEGMEICVQTGFETVPQAEWVANKLRQQVEATHA